MATPRETFEDYNPLGYPRRFRQPRTSGFEEFAKDTLALVPEPYKAPFRQSIPDTATIAPTGALTSPNIIGAGLGQLGQIIPDLGKVSLDLGPKWLAESIFANKEDFEKKQQRDLAMWQLPLDITSKHPSVHPTVRHWAGTLSDSTDATDLLMYYFFAKGPTQSPVGTSAGGMASAFNINPTIPANLLKQGVKTTTAGLASAPWFEYQSGGTKIGDIINKAVSPLSVVPKTLDTAGKTGKFLTAPIRGTINQGFKQIGKTISDINELSRLKPFRNTSVDSGIGASGYSPFSQFNKGVRDLDNWTLGNIGKGAVNILEPIVPRNAGYSSLAEFGFEAGISSANRTMDQQKDPSFMTYASVYAPAVIGGLAAAGTLLADSKRVSSIPQVSGLARSAELVGKNLNKTLTRWWRSGSVGKSESAVMESIADLDNVFTVGKQDKDWTVADFTDNDLILLNHPKNTSESIVLKDLKDVVGAPLILKDIKDFASPIAKAKDSKFSAVPVGSRNKKFDYKITNNKVFVNINDIDNFKEYFYWINTNVEPKEFKNASTPKLKSILNMFDQMNFDEIVDDVQKYNIDGKSYFNLADVIPAMDNTSRSIRIKTIENQGAFGIGENVADTTVVYSQIRALKDYLLGLTNQMQGAVSEISNKEAEDIEVASNLIHKILDARDAYTYETLIIPLYKRTLEFDKVKFNTLSNAKKDLIIQDWETRFPQSFDELSNLYVYKDDPYGSGQLYTGGPRDYESSPLNLLKQRNPNYYYELWEEFLFHPYNYLEPRSSVGDSRIFPAPFIQSGTSTLRSLDFRSLSPRKEQELTAFKELDEQETDVDMWGFPPLVKDMVLDDMVIEEYLKNPWLKFLALSKTLRANKNLLKPKPSTLNKEILLGDYGRYPMPEDPRFEMNQYYGAWKINEEDNFINKNDHVRDALQLLKEIGQQQITVKIRGVDTPIYPYLDFPDFMLHYGQPSFGMGNVKNLELATQYNMNVLTSKTDYGLGMFATKHGQLKGIPQGIIPDTEGLTFEKGVDPEMAMLNSFVSAKELLLLNTQFRGFSDMTVMSGTPTVGDSGKIRNVQAYDYQLLSPNLDIDTVFSANDPAYKEIIGLIDFNKDWQDFVPVYKDKLLGAHASSVQLKNSFENSPSNMGRLVEELEKLKQRDASISEQENMIRDWGIKNHNDPDAYHKFKHEPSFRLSSAEAIVSMDPNSPMSLVNRLLKRSGYGKGHKNNTPNRNYTEHLLTNPNDGLKLLHYRYEIAKNNGGSTSFILSEIQKPNYTVPKVTDEIKAHLPFRATKIFTASNAADAVKEAKRLENVMTPLAYTAAKNSGNKLGAGFDIPIINDRHGYGMVDILKSIRSSAESKYIKANYKNESEQFSTLSASKFDASLYGPLLYFNKDKYVVTKLSQKFNNYYKEPNKVFTDNPFDVEAMKNTGEGLDQLSWSGGEDRNLDMVVEARTLAVLEHWFKSTIAGRDIGFSEKPYKPVFRKMVNTYNPQEDMLTLEGIEEVFPDIYTKDYWVKNDFIKAGINDGTLFDDFIDLFLKDVPKPEVNQTEEWEKYARGSWAEDWDKGYRIQNYWLQGLQFEKHTTEEGETFYKAFMPEDKVIGGERVIVNGGADNQTAKDITDSNIVFHENILKQLFASPESKGYDSKQFWEVYDYVRDRMRYSTFDPVSEKSFSPSVERETLNTILNKAIEGGHSNIVLPTSLEIAIRNSTQPTVRGIRQYKNYDDYPKMMASIMDQRLKSKSLKEPYKKGDIKVIPFDINKRHLDYNQDGVFWQPNERSWNVKIPQKLIDNYWDLKNDPATEASFRIDNGEVKALVEHGPNGDGNVVHVFLKPRDTADIRLRTYVHELSHMLRRDLDDDELRIVNEYYGVKDGRWDTEAEEAFAQGMEDYYIKNKTPDPSLVAPFKNMLRALLYLFKVHVWADFIHGKNLNELNKLFKKLWDEIPDDVSDENIKEFLKSSDMESLSDKIVDAFGVSKQQAESGLASIQARAASWSKKTGKPMSEWWNKRSFDVVKGDEKTLDQYKIQAGVDIVTRQNDNALPNTIGSTRTEAVLDKVIERVVAAPKYRDEIESNISKQRSIEAGRINSAIQSSRPMAGGTDDPLETAARAQGALGGEKQSTIYYEPLVGFNKDKFYWIEPLNEEGSMLSDEIRILFNEIRLQYFANKIKPYDYANTNKALRKILHGEVPNRYEIDLLKKAFGKKGEQLGIAASKKKNTALAKQTWNITTELLFQSPKTLMSSMDLSGLLRQGWLYAVNPMLLPQTLRATSNSMLSFISSSRTKLIHDALVDHELFEMAEQSGLQIITPDSKSLSEEWATVTNKNKRALTNYFNPEFKAAEGEELFGSETVAARLVPWAKMSERGYTTVLNWLRFQRFEQQIMAARRKGWIHKSDPFLQNKDGTWRTPEEAGFQEMSDMDLYAITDGINTATGAGRLNFMFERNPDTGKLAPKSRLFESAVGNIFWAFKLAVSRFKVVLGVPMILQKGKKIGGASSIDSNLTMEGFITPYLKRKKRFDKQGNRILDEKGQDTGKPYWVGIEMGGTSFLSNSPLAKKLGLTKYYNGEGFEITLPNGKKHVMPDWGLKLMHIPDYVASVSALGSALYGLYQVFKHHEIDAYVGYDPKSSDFGKVVVGPVRVDVIGGYGPSVRFIANLITGQTVTSGTDREYEINRLESALRFARSKLNPILGKLSDFMETELGGEGFMGEKFDWTEDLWDLVIGMNAKESAEILMNSLPPEDGGNAYVPWAMMGLSTFGAGANPYFTADTVTHTYFVGKDGTRYRFSELEPYMQSLAGQLVPDTESIIPNTERTIEEVMDIYNGKSGSRDDLTYQEVLKARLFKLSTLVVVDENNKWKINDPNIIDAVKRGDITGSSTPQGPISASLSWELYKKVIDIEKQWNERTDNIFNIKFGVSPDKDISKIEDDNVRAAAEYIEAIKNAEYELGTNSTIYNENKKQWEDKYAPKLSELKDKEEGKRFTDEAIKAIEKNPNILNKYVTEEWKYTIRNQHNKSIPIGILKNIFALGYNKDGTYSSAFTAAWERYRLPQLLREQHIKTYNFDSFRSGVLDIPVQEDRKLTPELLQMMIYYNIDMDMDGTTRKGLPIE